jgi:hypothetical protein
MLLKSVFLEFSLAWYMGLSWLRISIAPTRGYIFFLTTFFNLIFPPWPDSPDFVSLILGYFVSRNFIHLIFLFWFIGKLLLTWNSVVFLTSNISTVWYSSLVVTAELISENLHLSWMPKLIHLIAGYFSKFLQLSQSDTRIFPSLPPPQPEFGLLPQWPKISSVICSCSGSKNLIILDIRRLSWLSVFHQPYILTLSWLPVFYQLYVPLLIWIPKFNQSDIRFLLWVPHSF